MAESGPESREITDMSDVTRLLPQIQAQIEVSEGLTADQLLPVVYDELRRLAASKLIHERPGQRLQATALVHEAYVRLVEGQEAKPWDTRGHFFAAAAEAMRRILVENARRRTREKYGANRQRHSLASDIEVALPMPPDDLIALHEALEKFESQDPDAARLVKLRFFAGLSMSQVAETVNRPLRTVEREWTYARSWLHRELSRGDTTSG